MHEKLPLTPAAEPGPRKYAPLEHMVQLDAVRALAALMVLFGHFSQEVRHLVEVQHMGVRLFYVLSGFLITGILLRCRDLADSGTQGTWQVMKLFYARRFLRIFPLFYATLLVYFVGALVLHRSMPASHDAAAEYHKAKENIGWLVSYLANFRMAWTGQNMGPVSAYWSLAVEEQFYIVWPWLIMLVPRAALMPLILATVVMGPGYRLGSVLYQLSAHGGAVKNWHAVTMPTFACMDTLGMGALLAMLSHKGADPAWRRRLMACGFWVGGALMAAMWVKHKAFYRVNDPVHLVVHDLAQGLFYAWVIGTAARGFQNAQPDVLMKRTGAALGGLGRALAAGAKAACAGVAWVLSLGWLRYLGTISYGVYVYHNFLWYIPHERLNAWLAPKLAGLFAGNAAAAQAWLNHWFSDHGLGLFLPRILATIALAALSWHFFEKPLNDLKRHFEYDKGRKSKEPQREPKSQEAVAAVGTSA